MKGFQGGEKLERNVKKKGYVYKKGKTRLSTCLGRKRMEALHVLVPTGPARLAQVFDEHAVFIQSYTYLKLL